MKDHSEIEAEHERQRLRRNRLAQQASGDERLQRMALLQLQAMQLLESSPNGMLHFKQRNYRSRQARLVNGIYQPVSPDRPIPRS